MTAAVHLRPVREESAGVHHHPGRVRPQFQPSAAGRVQQRAGPLQARASAEQKGVVEPLGGVQLLTFLRRVGAVQGGAGKSTLLKVLNGDWLAKYAQDNNLVSDPECGLLIMTMDTVSSCVPRAEGEYDNFTAACPDFDTARIFKADYDGTTDKGNTAANAVFTAHPEIKKWLVTGANEEGTIGAVRALESMGLDKDACVVGLGAYMAKDEWNDKGADGTCMKASAYFSSDSVGAGSVDVLYQIIDGGTPEMETAVDAVVVTPETYKEVMGKAAD